MTNPPSSAPPEVADDIPLLSHEENIFALLEGEAQTLPTNLAEPVKLVEPKLNDVNSTIEEVSAFVRKNDRGEQSKANNNVISGNLAKCAQLSNPSFEQHNAKEIVEIPEGNLALTTENWDDEINALINSATKARTPLTTAKTIDLSSPGAIDENFIEQGKPSSITQLSAKENAKSEQLSNALDELLASDQENKKQTDQDIHELSATTKSNENSIPLLDYALADQMTKLQFAKESAKNTEQDMADSGLLSKIFYTVVKFWKILLFICLIAGCAGGYYFWHKWQTNKKIVLLIETAIIDGTYAYPRSLDNCLAQGLKFYLIECPKGKNDCVADATERYSFACLDKQAKNEINKLDCNNELNNFNLQCGVGKYCLGLINSARDRCHKLRGEIVQATDKSVPVTNPSADDSSDNLPQNPSIPSVATISKEQYQNQITRQAQDLINNSGNGKSIEIQLEYLQNRKMIDDFLNYSQRIAQPQAVKGSKYVMKQR